MLQRRRTGEEERKRGKRIRRRIKRFSGIEGGQVSRVQLPAFRRMTFKLCPLSIVLKKSYDLCSEKINCSSMIYLFCHFFQSLLDIKPRYTSMAAIAVLWKVL